jgi:hypothetical protein
VFKIAAVERRKARLPPLKRRAGTFQKVPMKLAPDGAPPPSGRQRNDRAKARKRGQDGLTAAGTCRAAPEARAHSTAKERNEEQHEMREFRPKPFRLKTTKTEALNKNGLTEEQHKAMLAEFDRRIMQFRQKWRFCPNRRCRRQMDCLGPPLVCNGNRRAPRLTSRLYHRLKRDLYRDPPQVLGASDPQPSRPAGRRKAVRECGPAGLVTTSQVGHNSQKIEHAQKRRKHL